MFDTAIQQIIDKIAAAPINRNPFAYIQIEEIFPADFYETLRGNMPVPADYRALIETERVTKDYSPHRLTLFPNQLDGLTAEARAFWSAFYNRLLAADLAQAILAKFGADLKNLSGIDLNILPEAYLMRDEAGYELGPHTDSPAKVVSVLFYMPEDDSRPDLGTSFYVPKDPAFFCPGGPHHPFELFDCVGTLPYRRNALLAFPKTERCFHGVEPVPADGAHRDLLLYDLRRV
ncbi:MAG: hypothetical protein O3A84_02925 [Proteobacteria bacterium]|nr:hypothetical protein [Pseudomonadota bacterium]